MATRKYRSLPLENVHEAEEPAEMLNPLGTAVNDVVTINDVTEAIRYEPSAFESQVAPVDIESLQALGLEGIEAVPARDLEVTKPNRIRIVATDLSRWCVHLRRLP